MYHENGRREVAAKRYLVDQQGGYMTRQNFWYVIKRYAKQTGIDSEISPHTLRHAFAAQFAQSRRWLAQCTDIIGSQRLSTTQIYTRGFVRLQQLSAASSARLGAVCL